MASRIKLIKKDLLNSNLRPRGLRLSGHDYTFLFDFDARVLPRLVPEIAGRTGRLAKRVAMSNIATHDPTSPWHPGEVAMQRSTSQRSGLSPNEDSMPQMLTRMLPGTPYLFSTAAKICAHCAALRAPMPTRGETRLSM